jgi:cell division protein ZapA (FtsZ GTPase activity inhibitor)
VSDERTVVTVTIAGEDYNIRAAASPEYTRNCAAYFDRILSEYTRQGWPVQKGAILAALALTNELFETRLELDALRSDVARRGEMLASQIEKTLAARDLAAGS